MKRLFLNSKIGAVEDIDLRDDTFFVIQAEKVGEYIFIEYCQQDEVVDLIPFDVVNNGQKQQPKKQSDDEKIAEYRNVILNKDPFGKYSGKTLGEIVDSGDDQWIEKVLKNMKNDYIRTRLEFLVNNKGDDGLPF